MTTVVVAGVTGSGKTELARAICNQSEFAHINIGDLLAVKLSEAGLDTSTKWEIGPTFMDAFGLDGYLELVAHVVQAGDVVLDGLRIASALGLLREYCLTVTAFRTPPEGAAVSDQAYVRDLEYLRREADIVVPWCIEIRDVDVAARDVLALTVGRGADGRGTSRLT